MKNRHAGVAEAFGQHLQADSFSGSGGAGHQAVPVGHLRQ
jgi:hypothetical protein